MTPSPPNPTRTEIERPPEVARVLEEIEMDLRKGNIDFHQADAARAATCAVWYRLRALLAEQTARAEKLEVEANHLNQLVIKARTERDAALAACAEMREAAVGVDGRCRLCTARPREHRDNCALSRTDLGRGMVAVPGPIDALVDRLVLAVCDCHDGSDLWAHTRRDPETFRRAVRGALLDGGKVKP